MKTLIASAVLAFTSVSAHAATTPCEALTGVRLSGGEITAATVVAPGTFKAPPGGPGAPAGPPPEAGAAKATAGPPPDAGGGRQNAVFATPAFCRVFATLRPTADSDVRIEVWMPAARWNGRLEAMGNGGFGSNLQYNAMAEALAKGYTATGNNTGQTDNGKDIIDHPEKLKTGAIALSMRMPSRPSQSTPPFTAAAPKYSYWNSCSTGGRQGWVAAEYYPKDFDGLAIGDPANPMTRLQENSIAISLAVNKSDASFVSNEKWAAIHTWALQQCDAKDELKDGLI